LISAGAPPQTPLGELTALPQSPSWILGSPTSKEREGKGKRVRKKEKGEAKRRREKRDEAPN